jgi:Holliday junction resolvasome RuvABC endonuclease subunit
MNILALDCATRTGWATLIDGRIESGVQDFTRKRGESTGMIFLRFTSWLAGLEDVAVLSNTKRNFDLVVYEQAHHQGGAATEICVGLTTRAQEFATRIGAEYMPVKTTVLKKWATGRGNAGKEEMMRWFAREFGREPVTDDEADAAALLLHAIDELHLQR